MRILRLRRRDSDSEGEGNGNHGNGNNGNGNGNSSSDNSDSGNNGNNENHGNGNNGNGNGNSGSVSGIEIREIADVLIDNDLDAAIEYFNYLLEESQTLSSHDVCMLIKEKLADKYDSEEEREDSQLFKCYNHGEG